jgi:hypothetical protein
MSSDYYGSIAGEIADAAAREPGFLDWLNEFTRQEAAGDDLLAAFRAGRAAERERLATLLQAEADGRYAAADASTNGGHRPPVAGHVAAAGAYEHAADLIRQAQL